MAAYFPKRGNGKKVEKTADGLLNFREWPVFGSLRFPSMCNYWELVTFGYEDDCALP